MSKWIKIGRIAIPLVLALHTTVIVIVGFVLYSKFVIQHTSVLVQEATAQNTTGILGKATEFIGA